MTTWTGTEAGQQQLLGTGLFTLAERPGRWRG